MYWGLLCVGYVVVRDREEAEGRGEGLRGGRRGR